MIIKDIGPTSGAGITIELEPEEALFLAVACEQARDHEIGSDPHLSTALYSNMAALLELAAYSQTLYERAGLPKVEGAEEHQRPTLNGYRREYVPYGTLEGYIQHEHAIAQATATQRREHRLQHEDHDQPERTTARAGTPTPEVTA